MRKISSTVYVFFGTINQTNFKMIYSDATFFLGDNFGLVKFFFCLVLINVC